MAKLLLKNPTAGGGEPPPGPTVPTISSISMTSFPLGGGVAVTVTGANFIAATTARIGGLPLAGNTVVNATTITGTAPALQDGQYVVDVIDMRGSSALAALVTYVPEVAPPVATGDLLAPSAAWDGTRSYNGRSVPLDIDTLFGSGSAVKPVGRFDEPPHMYIEPGDGDKEFIVVADTPDDGWIDYVDVYFEGGSIRVYSDTSQGFARCPHRSARTGVCGFHFYLDASEIHHDGDGDLYARVVPKNGYSRLEGPLPVVTNCNGTLNPGQPGRPIKTIPGDYHTVSQAAAQAPSGAYIYVSPNYGYEDDATYGSDHYTANRYVDRAITFDAAPGHSKADVKITRQKFTPTNWYCMASKVIFKNLNLDIGKLYVIAGYGVVTKPEPGWFLTYSTQPGTVIFKDCDVKDPLGGIPAEPSYPSNVYTRTAMKTDNSCRYFLCESTLDYYICGGFFFARNSLMNLSYDAGAFSGQYGEDKFQGVSFLNVTLNWAGQMEVRTHQDEAEGDGYLYVNSAPTVLYTTIPNGSTSNILKTTGTSGTIGVSVGLRAGDKIRDVASGVLREVATIAANGLSFTLVSAFPSDLNVTNWNYDQLKSEFEVLTLHGHQPVLMATTWPTWWAHFVTGALIGQKKPITLDGSGHQNASPAKVRVYGYLTGIQVGDKLWCHYPVHGDVFQTYANTGSYDNMVYQGVKVIDKVGVQHFFWRAGDTDYYYHPPLAGNPKVPPPEAMWYPMTNQFTTPGGLGAVVTFQSPHLCTPGDFINLPDYPKNWWVVESVQSATQLTLVKPVGTAKAFPASPIEDANHNLVYRSNWTRLEVMRMTVDPGDPTVLNIYQDSYNGTRKHMIFWRRGFLKIMAGPLKGTRRRIVDLPSKTSIKIASPFPALGSDPVPMTCDWAVDSTSIQLCLFTGPTGNPARTARTLASAQINAPMVGVSFRQNTLLGNTMLFGNEDGNIPNRFSEEVACVGNIIEAFGAGAKPIEENCYTLMEHNHVCAKLTGNGGSGVVDLSFGADYNLGGTEVLDYDIGTLDGTYAPRAGSQVLGRLPKARFRWDINGNLYPVTGGKIPLGAVGS